MSCRTVAQVVDSAVLFDLGSAAISTAFARYVGGILGLEPAQITVNDLIVAPGAAVSTAASGFVPLRVEVTAQPALNPSTQVPASNCLGNDEATIVELNVHSAAVETGFL